MLKQFSLSKRSLPADKENIENKTTTPATIVVSYSASTQAFLRAYLDLCGATATTDENNISKNDVVDKGLAAILMIAPGVGLNIHNYMERLIPGSFKRLKDGQVLQHPSVDPQLNIQVNMKCLEEFVDVCAYLKKNFLHKRTNYSKEYIIAY